MQFRALLGVCQGVSRLCSQAGRHLNRHSGVARRALALQQPLSHTIHAAYGGTLLASTTTGLRAFAAGSFPSSSSIVDQLTLKEMGLLSWLVVDLAINWGGWALATLFKTEKFYDLLGSTSFLVLSVGSLLTSKSIATRKYVATALVVSWAVRLGSFLVMRVMKTGHDSRFDKAKNEPGTFFIYWTMQAVWVFVTSLPLLLLNTSTAGGPKRLLWTDVVGVAVFLTGFLLESTADLQKYLFKADPANKGQFIDTGLWHYARYPNYFGEMLVWWGIFTTCASGLQGPQFVSVISPVFVMLLLRFVSGVPLQEKQALERWGGSPEYQEYLARTNLLVPLPGFKAKCL